MIFIFAYEGFGGKRLYESIEAQDTKHLYAQLYTTGRHYLVHQPKVQTLHRLIRSNPTKFYFSGRVFTTGKDKWDNKSLLPGDARRIIWPPPDADAIKRDLSRKNL